MTTNSGNSSYTPSTRSAWDWRRWMDLSILIVVSGLSVYFTGTFWLALGGNLVVLGAIVYVWEAGKFRGIDDLAEEFAAWWPSAGRRLDIGLTIGLVVVFIACSAAYTTGGNLVEAKQEAEAARLEGVAMSARIPALRSELADLDRDIKAAQEEIDQHVAKRWDTAPIVARLDRYRDRRGLVAGELDELTGSDAARLAGESGVSPRFLALAGAWSASPLPSPGGIDGDDLAAWLERWFMLIIGLFFEAVSIVYVLKGHMRRVRGTVEPFSGGRGKSSVPPGDSENTGQEQDCEIIEFRGHRLVWTAEIDAKYRELVAELQARSLKPGVRQIKGFMGIGANGAEVIRAKLARDQVCEWDQARRRLSLAG